MTTKYITKLTLCLVLSLFSVAAFSWPTSCPVGQILYGAHLYNYAGFNMSGVIITDVVGNVYAAPVSNGGSGWIAWCSIPIPNPSSNAKVATVSANPDYMATGSSVETLQKSDFIAEGEYNVVTVKIYATYTDATGYTVVLVISSG